jgi:hypothetical protein
MRFCIFLNFAIFASLSVQGQSFGVKINLSEDPSGVIISWIPTNDSIWELGHKIGYHLRRLDMENGQSVIIQDSIFPFPKSWFNENKEAESGMIGALGKILHDTTNFEESWANSQSRNIRYRYLAYEAKLDARIAAILGMGALDTSAVLGKRYLYEVLCSTGTDGILVGRKEVIIGDFSDIDSTESTQELDIVPPNGIPLTRMRNDFGRINQIQAVSKAYGDSVILRWMPNSIDFWRASNQYGYQIFRMEITSDTSVLPGNSNYVLIDSIAPWSKEKFEMADIEADSLLIVAAQCLYGNYYSSSDNDLMVQSSEVEMRFGMAALAADRSPLAANALGLRYVDRSVSPNTMYDYLIVSGASSSFVENAIISVFNSPSNSLRLSNYSADSLDRAILLKWDKGSNNIFSGYKIERSDDGGRSYTEINNAPLLYLENPDEQERTFFSFTDSIPQNYKPYYYRISGVDAFGDWSEPVEVVGMGIDLTPPPPPVMILAQATLKGVIQLKWEVPERPEDLKYFHVLLSDHLDGEYAEVASRLPVTAREYVYQGPLNTMRSYYFRLSAEDDKGNRSTTLSYYVHLVDSIAPASPEKLEYRVDSSGIVTLVWEHGDEPDLLGYRVYVANNPNHEFAQLTKEPTPLNAWLDTLNLGLLDKEIYYRVVAEDRSHNLSPFSEILPVKRPDIIPPAAPVLLPIASDLEGIRLRWSPSPSNDLAGYILLRKIEQDSVYYPVRLIGADTTSWHDTTALPEVLYEYSIQAMDQSGLLSELSFPLKGRRMLDLSLLGIERLLLTYNTKDTLAELQWTFRPNSGAIPKDSGYLFYLYKKKDPGGWSKIKQFDADISGYKDPDIKQPGKYAYAIKVVRLDGRSGVLTESGWIEVVEPQK